MNHYRNKYIFYILVLKEWCVKIIGPHYPVEIIEQIIMLAYTKISISCGWYNTKIITNKTYHWGMNTHRESAFLCLRIDDLNSECQFASYLGANITFSYGDYHTVCLVKSKLSNIMDKIFVWGCNCNGELGLGHNNRVIQSQMTELILPEPNVLMISCGGYHTACLTSTHTLYGWGQNADGQLGLGHCENQSRPHKLNFDGVDPIIYVSCGGYHMACLTSNGQTYVCGYGEYGQLGLGDRMNRSILTKLDLEGIVSIKCGGFHTVALTKFDVIYVWGRNNYGQLGSLSPIARPIPHRIDSEIDLD